MPSASTVIILVIAHMVGGLACVPARAEPGAGRGAAHRLTAHRGAGHAGLRPLTFRRRAPVEVTRDFDPVPPDPLVVGFFRGLEGYGTEARLEPPFGPRVFRDF